MSAAVVAAVKARLANKKGKSDDYKDLLTMYGLEKKYQKQIDNVHQRINYAHPITPEAKTEWFNKLVDDLVTENITNDTENWVGTFPCGVKGTPVENDEAKCLKIIEIIYKASVLKNLEEVRQHVAKHLLLWMRCEAEKVKPTKNMFGKKKYLQKDNTCKFPVFYNEKKNETSAIPYTIERKQEEMDKFIKIGGESLLPLEGMKFNFLLDAEMKVYCECKKYRDVGKIFIDQRYVYPDHAEKCIAEAGVTTENVEVSVREPEHGGRRRRRRKSRKKRRKSRRKSRRKNKSRKRRRRTRRRRR